jgi:hypothetical protein
MFSVSMFGPFRCSVFRGLVPFKVRSCDIQSFDVRSHSTFSLSMFGPIRGSVFRCLVLFDIRSFDVRSFEVQSFEVRSFEVRSFEVRSRFPWLGLPAPHMHIFPGQAPCILGSRHFPDTLSGAHITFPRNAKQNKEVNLRFIL